MENVLRSAPGRECSRIRVRVDGQRALTLLVVAGLALRFWQYAANPSFWYDELSIARNVIQRPFHELVTQPLLYSQVAPVGFVAALKISTLVLGPSDLALRLVPFLCGIASLLLFRKLAERTLESAPAIISVALFAFAIPLIRYTTELKQYGADVMITLTLTLVAFAVRDASTTRRCVLAGLLGFVVIWFSQASILVMGGVGLALIILQRRQAATTVALWALASLLGVLVARHYTTPDTVAYMRRFWDVRHGFVSFPPPLPTATQFFGDPWMLAYPLPQLYTALAVVGFVVLWSRRRDVTLILASPLLVALIASAARQYPFHTRVSLFLLPSIVVMLATALTWIKPRVIGALLLSGPVYAIATRPPPYEVESYKPMFAFFRAHSQPADRVYVFFNTFAAADFYGPRYGLSSGSYTVGVCDRQDNHTYLTDLDQFRGAPRVWVLSSGVPPYASALRTIGRYLRTIGVRVDSIVLPSWRLGPVSAVLYNLSDRTRLSSTQAVSFAVDAIPDTLRPACRSVARPAPTE